MPTKTKRKATTDNRRSGKAKDRRTRTVNELLLRKSRDRHYARAYADTLPFSVHDAHTCFPMPSAEVEAPGCSLDNWSRSEAAVADSVLRTGRMRLSVAVPAPLVAQGASMIARALKTPVCMGYDPHNERLIVWNVVDPSDIDDDEADEG